MPSLRPCSNVAYCGNWIPADVEPAASEEHGLGPQPIYFCESCRERVLGPQVQAKVVTPRSRAQGRRR